MISPEVQRSRVCQQTKVDVVVGQSIVLLNIRKAERHCTEAMECFQTASRDFGTREVILPLECR